MAVRIRLGSGFGMRCRVCGGPAPRGEAVHWRRVYDDRPPWRVPYVHRDCMPKRR